MDVENTRRQIKSSAAVQADKFSANQYAIKICTGLFRRLGKLAVEIRGAIEDHRKWVNSDRARALGTAFEISGRLFTYAAYAALGYLAYNSFVAIRNGLAAGIYVVPVQSDGPRVALFNILAGGLVGPIVIVAIAFAIGWAYNLATAAARRYFPRFVQPCVHPSILFAVVAAFTAYHSTVTTMAAKSYLYAKTNIDAASPDEVVSIKVIEISGQEISHIPDIANHDTPSERELVRLRSMFERGRPCPKENQGTTSNPQTEVVRPEPGLAPGRDCLPDK